MSGTLHVSPTISPFPYAAAAAATYTQKAEIAFDEGAKEATLELNGSKITGEDQIVLGLAKAAELADDSSKVRNFKLLCYWRLILGMHSVSTLLLARGSASADHSCTGGYLSSGFRRRLSRLPNFFGRA